MSDSITIVNTKAQTVATVAPKTVDTSSPLSLVGRGYSGHAKIFNENLYRLLENFHNTTAPSNPKSGQLWSHEGVGLKWYSGATWIQMATGLTTEIQLTRLASASNINFNATGSHQIHTGVAGASTLVTSIVLVTKATTSVAGAPPSFQLETSTNSANIADKIVLTGLNATSKFAKYNMTGSNTVVAAGSTVSLNIKTATTGGDVLICDVYLYGLVI